MVKLSKQDKIDIYNLWKNNHIGSKKLSDKYGVNKKGITYLIALIEMHGFKILDQPHARYSLEFKEQAIKRIIVNQEAIYGVSVELGLKTPSMLTNWVRSFKENGYNVVIKPKGRPKHEHQRQADQAGKSPLEARKPSLTSSELETYCRKRICKKIARLSQPKEQESKAEEIAAAVTQLRRELKVSVTFILETINDNPDLPHMSRSNYYYTINKTDKDTKNQPLMTLIRKIYEDNKQRYGYRRVAQTIQNLGIKVNHKKIQRLMTKMKLYGIRIKGWRKYNSYRGTQGPIKPDLIRRNFSAILPDHKWYSDVTEFNLNGQKTYLSPIIDGCTQEIISYTISRSPNLKQTMDMLKLAWQKHPALNGLVFHTDQGWQYQHASFQAWLKNHGVEQSMSRKGNSLDDGLMEGFFGILKREMFYGFEKNFKNLTELEQAIREYIDYYNNERIKIKLKGLAPIKYRELVLS
ncbi:IS3 family transposase [Lactobacillus sp. ESL0701]|uniref:IS3 family transposase n=2 Tax=Lactobacillus TaxID=1578 RepID=UPI0032AF01C0